MFTGIGHNLEHNNRESSINTQSEDRSVQQLQGKMDGEMAIEITQVVQILYNSIKKYGKKATLKMVERMLEVCVSAKYKRIDIAQREALIFDSTVECFYPHVKSKDDILNKASNEHHSTARRVAMRMLNLTCNYRQSKIADIFGITRQAVCNSFAEFKIENMANRVDRKLFWSQYNAVLAVYEAKLDEFSSEVNDSSQEQIGDPPLGENMQ